MFRFLVVRYLDPYHRLAVTSLLHPDSCASSAEKDQVHSSVVGAVAVAVAVVAAETE